MLIWILDMVKEMTLRYKNFLFFSIQVNKEWEENIKQILDKEKKFKRFFSDPLKLNKTSICWTSEDFAVATIQESLVKNNASFYWV